ncbi:MAG: hypothetical protein Ct9H300mP19_09710 [Dehalococcoidia bacterium]|nr:MAG: hypothetical protein Ct9H300mP19_09710 [Dehalococcoidia bacterium]
MAFPREINISNAWLAVFAPHRFFWIPCPLRLIFIDQNVDCKDRIMWSARLGRQLIPRRFFCHLPEGIPVKEFLGLFWFQIQEPRLYVVPTTY